jgi:hypothetical protein
MRLSFTAPVLCGALLGPLAPLAKPATTIPNAAQPQLAATTDSRVFVAFGRGKEIFVTASRDGGTTFEEPVRVAALPSVMVGRRRGPRIAAHGDHVTVTVMAGELFAFHSKDSGKTWAGPVLVNDVRRSAREGLNGLAMAPDGRLFTTWLDLRGERTQLYGAESTDGGATWSANQLVYRAPAGSTVCECCHPSAVFNARGDLSVMWRNAIGTERDMWLATRAAGTTEFGPAAKLGEGSWTLKACPMDGGAVFINGSEIGSVWQRANAVFFARPGQPEVKIAAGVQPVAAHTSAGSVAVWQQGADLWTTTLGPASTPRLLARNAKFPAIGVVAAPERTLVAYEHGTDTLIVPLGTAAAGQ